MNMAQNISRPCGFQSVITGFTLIELLVTVSIAAILLTLAIPNMRDFMLNNRLVTQNNELALALAYAKSEAVKRGARVTVCSRQTDTTCAGTTTWESGWLVYVDGNANGSLDDFVDANGNGVLDPGETPPETILKVQGPLQGGNTLRAGRNRIHFQSTGFSAGSNTTFTLCDSRGTGSAKALILSGVGRTRTATDSAADGDSIVDDGETPPVNVACP